MYIDTHAHLYIEEFDDDRQEVIQEAIDERVSLMLLPAIEQKYTTAMHQTQALFPDHIKLMMGLHPCYVKDNYVNELAHVEAELASGKYIAVGEIGIDLYWDTSNLKQQQMAFEKQIQWAKQYQLPIVIHGRNSFDEIFEILENTQDGTLSGVFHCFSGDLIQAQKIIELGIKLGIGGVATFKNGKIDQYLNKIPLEYIVLETDAPYLAPAPYRGKRNKSAYIPVIANRLAEIYQKSVHEIANITTQNALQLFKLDL